MRVVAFALIFCLTMIGGVADAFARYASIIVEADTGTVLYARNADERLYPASLTKMMTLYMLFEQLEQGKMTLKTPLKASKRAEGMPPSKVGIKAGESITVEEAIKVLVTKSANDVAVVVAENIAGSETAFAERMTRKAGQLGMKRTTFRNASGLPNNGQKSTAEDMATLALALQKHFPQYYRFFATTSASFKGRTFNTHNHVLTRYSGADGLKTGYINASGFNVVSSAVRNGRRLIGVVFGGKTSRSRDDHMIALLNRGFELAAEMDSLPPPRRKPVLMADGSVKLNPKTVAALMAPLPDRKPVPGSTPAVVAAVAAPVPVARPAPEVTTPAAVAVAAIEPRPAAPAVTAPTALAAATPAPAANLPQGSADPDPEVAAMADKWGVQVGAFSRFESAQMKAAEAAAKLRTAVEGSHPRISTLRENGDTIYRARVMGMTEDEARNACNTLRGLRLPCIVVPPDVKLAMRADTR